MRSIVTGEWTSNSLLRLIVCFFLFYILLFWGTNWLLFFQKMGLSYTSVVEYYLGSEERFLQPRTYHGLLEMAHIHLFAMGVLMLTLTHLLLFVPFSGRVKALLITVSFSSALSNEASGWLIRFIHPCFAYLKIISFLCLQFSLALMIGLAFYALVSRSPSDYLSNGSPKRKANA